MAGAISRQNAPREMPADPGKTSVISKMLLLISGGTGKVECEYWDA
jgi:hypothetical protein